MIYLVNFIPLWVKCVCKEYYQEHCHTDLVEWSKDFLSDGDLELTLVVATRMGPYLNLTQLCWNYILYHMEAFSS